MRIRTFAADTAQAAMAQVRAEMGEDAVIIAMDDAANGRGVLVRAAVASAEASANARSRLGPIEERLEAFLNACLRGHTPAGAGAH